MHVNGVHACMHAWTIRLDRPFNRKSSLAISNAERTTPSIARQQRWSLLHCLILSSRSQVQDPMMKHLDGGPLVPGIAIIACALGSLYAGFICFAQSVRLYVHTGFYIRACTSRFNPGTLTVAEAKRVTIHAGLAFTGERLLKASPLNQHAVPDILPVISLCCTAQGAHMFGQHTLPST
jgi:hypothetical protein